MRHALVVLWLISQLFAIGENVGAQSPSLPADSDAALKQQKLLHIVDCGGEKPLAAVPVHRIKIQDLPSDFECDLYRNLKNAIEKAETFESDAEGLCKLPPFSEESVILVWTNSRFGYLRMRPSELAIELRALPYQEVRVEVVDQELRAVPDVPVSLESLFIDSYQFPVGRPWCGRTGANGFALLLLTRLGETRATDKALAEIDLVFAERQVVELKADSTGLLSGRAVLPPFGRLQLNFNPLAGQTIPKAHLVAALRSGRPTTMFVPSQNSVEKEVGPDEKTINLIVGLNLDLTLLLDDSRKAYALNWNLTSPSVAGEFKSVALDLPQGTGRFLVRGRLVDPKGDVFANKEFEYYDFNFDASDFYYPGVHILTPIYWPLETKTVRTDAAGRFEFTMDVVQSGQDVSLTYVLQFGPKGARHRSEPLEFDLGGAEPVELNDVVLTAEPLVVSGRVLDTAGRPIAAARLQVRDKGSRVHFGSLFQTDANGYFEIRSDLVCDNLTVLVHKDKHDTATVSASYGQRELEIRLERLALLSGRLRLAGQDPSFLGQIIGRAGSDLRPRDIRIDGRGEFSEYLPPGSHQLKFQLDCETLQDVAELGEIKLVAGETKDLGVIDLEVPGTLCRIQLDVQDPRDGAPGLAILRIYAPGSPEPIKVIRRQSLKKDVTFQVDALPVEVEVDCINHQIERIELKTWQGELRLRRAPFVQVQIEGLEDLPENARVWFDFPENDGLQLGRSSNGPWPISCENPEVWFRARAAGAYQLNLKLGMEGEGPTSWLSLRPNEPWSFSVDREPRTQKVIIQLERELVMNVWKKLQAEK